MLKQPIPAKGAADQSSSSNCTAAAILIGRARLERHRPSPAGDGQRNPMPPEIAAILAVAADKRTERTAEGAGHARAARQRSRRKLAALPKPQMVYAAASDFDTTGSFKPPNGPRPVHVLKRGDITKPRRGGSARQRCRA